MFRRIGCILLSCAAGFACSDESVVGSATLDARASDVFSPEAGSPDAGADADASGTDTGSTDTSSTDAGARDGSAEADWPASDASDTGADTGGRPLEIRVTSFDRQPMVVDIGIVGADASALSCEFPADPGVRIQKTSVAALSTRCRLRGLRPGTSHRAAVRRGSEVLNVDFTTPPALRGFTQSFALESNDTPAPGLRLFDLSSSPDILESSFVAVDTTGVTRFYVEHSSPNAGSIPERVPAGIKLLDDGTVMFTQGYDFHVIDEFGDAVLHLGAQTLGVAALHHDVILLPNGNFVALAWEFRDVVIPGDTQTSTVLGDKLIEFTRAGSVVWSWSALDNLDLGRQRLFSDRTIEDPTRPGVLGRDWTHGNAVVYSATDDSLLVSLRHQDFLVKIRRGDGATLWRLGEGGDFSLSAGEWFYHQHAPEWQSDGTLLVFDNGNGRPNVPLANLRTRVVHLRLDEAARTATILHELRTDDYFQTFAGDADRLSNGNVLVTDANVTTGPDQGTARVTEAELATGRVIWRLRAPGKMIYRCLPVTRLPGESASGG
jgi:hypothetical protein